MNNNINKFRKDLKKFGFSLKEKKRGNLFKDKNFSSLYNQIWTK